VTDAFTAIEERRPLSVDALACINAILALDGGYERIEPAKTSGYTLAHVRANDDVSATLVPIARDIAGLLATPNAPVRHCAGAGCVRHFYDDSRTGRRRWCEMAICGNRAKAAAFTARRGPRSQERTPNR
jgi:predicted RNA-binding Zn ribbon-like protein